MFFDNDYYEEDSKIYAFLEEDDFAGGDAEGAIADADDALGEAYNSLYDFSNVQIAFANYYSEQVIACAQAEANAVVSEDSYTFSEAEETFKERAINAVKGMIKKIKDFLSEVKQKIKSAVDSIKKTIQGRYKEFMTWVDGRAWHSKSKRIAIKDFKKGCTMVISLSKRLKDLDPTGEDYTKVAGEKGAVLDQLKKDYSYMLNDTDGAFTKLEGDDQAAVKKHLKEMIKQVSSGLDADVKKAADQGDAALTKFYQELGSSEAGRGASIFGRVISFFAGIIRRFFGAVVSSLALVFGAVKDFVRMFAGGSGKYRNQKGTDRQYGSFGTNAKFESDED